MPFLVQGCIDDHTLAVTTATAKEAFAKAVEWQVAQGFTDILIYDGVTNYSIDAFSLAMVLLWIASTVEAASEPELKAKEK